MHGLAVSPLERRGDAWHRPGGAAISCPVCGEGQDAILRDLVGGGVGASCNGCGGAEIVAALLAEPATCSPSEATHTVKPLATPNREGSQPVRWAPLPAAVLDALESGELRPDQCLLLTWLIGRANHDTGVIRFQLRQLRERVGVKKTDNTLRENLRALRAGRWIAFTDPPQGSRDGYIVHLDDRSIIPFRNRMRNRAPLPPSKVEASPPLKNPPPKLSGEHLNAGASEADADFSESAISATRDSAPGEAARGVSTSHCEGGLPDGSTSQRHRCSSSSSSKGVKREVRSGQGEDRFVDDLAAAFRAQVVSDDPERIAAVCSVCGGDLGFGLGSGDRAVCADCIIRTRGVTG
jgi:hypothetical protein